MHMITLKEAAAARMAKKAKGGRPPKPARLRRTPRLQLLLTVAEHKALNNVATQRETTASEILRDCLRTLLEAAGANAGKGGRP